MIVFCKNKLNKIEETKLYKSCNESKVCKKDVEFVNLFYCKKTYLIEEEEEETGIVMMKVKSF